MLYSIYGLCLDADLAIPGLSISNDILDADVRIRLTPARDPEAIDVAAEEVWYRNPLQREEGAPDDSVLTIFRSIDHGGFRFRYPDGVEFLIDRSGSEVRARWPSTSTLEDVALYLTGPVLGFLLRLRGVVSLHASVVGIDSQAVAFVGPAGAGKSTTAAAFAKRGFPVLTEDVAALFEHDGAFAVRPGYPHIGLWPDSASMLFGSREALPPFTPGWDKRCLTLTAAGAFVDRPLPLRAIYLISDRRGAGAPSVASVPVGTAVITLVGNIYGNLLFHRELRVPELDVVRKLVTTVPVRSATRGVAPASVDALCDAVLDDLARRSTGPVILPATNRDVQHF